MERIIGRAFAFLVGASCASVALAVACGGIVDDEQTPASFADASGTPAIDARADLDGGATRDADASTPKDPCVAPPGTLDTTFGNGGVVVVPGVARGRSVVVLSDGSIVIGAKTPNVAPGYGGDALVRLRSDGTLETSFGDGGFHAPVGGDWTTDGPVLAVQADGKLVTAGTSGQLPPNGARLWVVTRRLADGTKDISFADGERLIGFGGLTGMVGGTGRAASAIVQADGRILVSGTAPGFGQTFHAVVRLQSDGGFDTTLANQGRLVIPSGGPGVLALAADGSFVVAGASGNDLSAARLTPDGSLDTSFGDAGQVLIEHESSSQALAATFDSNGSILLAGHLGSDFAVFRMTATGAMDATFGDAGVVTAGVDEARAVFAEADGKVIVVGSATIARFTSNGAPDPAFGTGGVVTNTNGVIEGAAVNGCHIVTVGSQGAAVVVARWRR